MADLTIAVDSSLARDLFASLDYPFRMRVGDKALADVPLAGGAELDWDADVGSFPEDQIADFDAGPLLEATVQGYFEQGLAAKFVADADDAEAAALVAAYADGIVPDSPDAVAKVLERMAVA